MFNPADYPELLVGLNQPDDAAVWKLNKTESLIITTDFFTPVVDDAFDYGAIAAANALSDIYAMGGEPFLALNLAAFPADMPAEVLSEVLRGAAETLRTAGTVLAGGHTIQDKEPKFGLVVIGKARTASILHKGGANPGDLIFLSKPLGIGVTTTALKQQKAAPEHLTEAVNWMKNLNRDASKLAVRYKASSATDITGYSLIGHALECASASGVRFDLKFTSIPLLSFAKTYADRGLFPGGAFDNLHYFGKQAKITAAISESEKMLLFDPQTSGGLLFTVAPEQAEKLQRVAKRSDAHVWHVGEVSVGKGIRIL